MYPPSGTRQTVMVADDTADVRELMALQLRLSGYEVVEARDGFEAVELAKARCPALIFMDIRMPGMDGLAAARAIRGIRGLCPMVIVAFSAFGGGDNNRRLALEAGCDEYVSKDEGITQLVSITRRLIPDA